MRVNLNTGTRAEFGEIPGVGNRMIREFMEYRPYVSIRQFRREIGKYVSDEQVAAYEQYVFVPIDPNEADAATLQQGNFGFEREIFPDAPFAELLDSALKGVAPLLAPGGIARGALVAAAATYRHPAAAGPHQGTRRGRAQ